MGMFKDILLSYAEMCMSKFIFFDNMKDMDIRFGYKVLKNLTPLLQPVKIPVHLRFLS